MSAQPARAPVRASAHDLAIAGLEPFSSCDWPGRLVATVFLQGCPWQCTYCHNVAIIDPRAPGTVSWAQVLDLLGRRVGRLDGVVFSGGEPTRQHGLSDAMRQVRAMGFGVGLHTGGAYPSRLAEVIGLVDWIGLDLKATPGTYAAVTGVRGSWERARQSLDLVLDARAAGGLEVQLRTTVDPTVLDDAHVAEIRSLLADRGVTSAGAAGIEHVLQRVRPEGTRPEYAERLAAAGVSGRG